MLSSVWELIFKGSACKTKICSSGRECLSNLTDLAAGPGQGSWLPRDGRKSSCWLQAATYLDKVPVDSHLGMRQSQQQEQDVKHFEPQLVLGFSVCLPQQLYPTVILVLGRREDRKVNLGLFLSAGTSMWIFTRPSRIWQSCLCCLPSLNATCC